MSSSIRPQSFGLKVPDDMAVIGIGNSSLASEMRPTITSVDIDDDKIAQTVVDIIRKRDNNEEITETSIDTGFRIIARESA